MEQWLPRSLDEHIQQQARPGKVLMLTGPRRTGKTALVRRFQAQSSLPSLFWNGEDLDVQQALSQRSRGHYQFLLQGTELLILDEAQYVPDVGLALKLMVDAFPDKTFVVTGSSSFELSGNLGQPLTGRKIDLHLYPLAQTELLQTTDPLTLQGQLPQRLIYGSYPELWHYTSPEQQQQYLKQLCSEYLFQDILRFENLQYSDKLQHLLRLLAHQIGHSVSQEELGRQLGLNRQTVERYLSLLRKTFVIFPLEGFSRNLRKEITKSKRWYFWDNGIRNALINNFNLPELRNDTGQLWENFLVSERLKTHAYRWRHVNTYFWRTYDQQEIDLIEESGGTLAAFEFKWGQQKAKPPKAWQDAYPESRFQVIRPANFLQWLSQE